MDDGLGCHKCQKQLLGTLGVYIKKSIFPGTINFNVALIVNVISIFDSNHTFSDSRTITLLINCFIILKFVTAPFLGSLMYGIDFFCSTETKTGVPQFMYNDRIIAKSIKINQTNKTEKETQFMCYNLNFQFIIGIKLNTSMVRDVVLFFTIVKYWFECTFCSLRR